MPDKTVEVLIEDKDRSKIYEVFWTRSNLTDHSFDGQCGSTSGRVIPNARDSGWLARLEFGGTWHARTLGDAIKIASLHIASKENERVLHRALEDKRRKEVEKFMSGTADVKITADKGPAGLLDYKDRK